MLLDANAVVVEGRIPLLQWEECQDTIKLLTPMNWRYGSVHKSVEGRKRCGSDESIEWVALVDGIRGEMRRIKRRKVVTGHRS